MFATIISYIPNDFIYLFCFVTFVWLVTKFTPQKYKYIPLLVSSFVLIGFVSKWFAFFTLYTGIVTFLIGYKLDLLYKERTSKRNELSHDDFKIYKNKN